MPSKFNPLRYTLLAVSLLALQAAAADGKDQQQLRGLQQRVRQAEQAKAQLTQQKAELDEQVKAAQDKLDQTRRSADAAERKRATLARELEAAAAERSALAEKLAELEGKLAQSQAQGGELQAKLGQVVGLLQRSEANGRQLGESLAAKAKGLEECSVKNEHLFQVSASLLGQYQTQGGKRLLEGEPVTGLARVAVENKLEEYRDLMEAQRLAQQQEHEKKLRQLAQQRLDQERATRERADQQRQQADRQQVAKAKQQSDLDKLTKRVTNFFDTLEW